MISKMIVKMMPIVPKFIVRKVAMKYIAGADLIDAVNVTKKLEGEGNMTTIDVLGEFVEKRDRAIHEKEMSSQVVDAIKEHKLQTYLSVKPTSLGLGIDPEFGYNNILEILKKAADYGIFVRLDMENTPFTTLTLDLYRRFRAEGFTNVGFVVQSYLFRTEEDIKALAPLKPSIRLCKGIYRESPTLAFQGKEEVRSNFKKLLTLALDNGYYVGIATHDDPLIDDAREQIQKFGLKKEEYEFQMLLGVRDSKRRELTKEGHRLRIYVPFGKDWYGYSTRRMKENPKVAGQIFKAMFSRG
ncbi:MAG: proline dehydrogenase family protein [Bacteroidota bacterium]